MLLVGGGRTAEAKLRPLRAAGAAIRSVALCHHPGFLREADRLGGVELIQGPYRAEHLAGVRLAVSATDDPDSNNSNTYGDFIQQALTQQITAGGGFGLAKMLETSLTPAAHPQLHALHPLHASITPPTSR